MTRKKALWTTLPSYRKAVPLATGASGKLKPGKVRQKPIRPVSRAQAKRNRAYKVVADKFKLENPRCDCCRPIFDRRPMPTTDVHHGRGKLGKLLTDVRFFIPACRECHRAIHDDPSGARAIGLLCDLGEWNRSYPL